ncbi:globin [Kocuria sp. HSID16901]|uniref:globin n=1 Tax=Kocuria sp. HSID16901 TaxID=2419505 RepID=UPI0006613ABC|nr:globin [Kocuria sp. HSID16901]RUQ22500.1 globin [Kocuria sp. HSID16901]
MTSPASAVPTMYEQLGGHAAIHRLTTEFYDRVERDPEFKAMYPEEDLEPARRRLEMFLEQYFGGPTTYSKERGHPRLRMRHAPFAINSWARERWLTYMREALDCLELPPLHDGMIWGYFERAAHAMTNTPDEPDASS